MSDITVIVPVYNMSDYIERCVESVLKQTYSDFRLILIDDGSIDNSVEKCVTFGKKDSRIIVVRKTNEGLGPTRNFGVHLSDTEYVTFLDADDWWHPDYLRYMMGGTKSGQNDIVLCDIGFVYQTPKGEYKNQTSKLRFSAGNLELNNEWNVINKARTFMWGKIYRRKLFTKHKILQPSHAYEDVATTPYLISKAKFIGYVPKELYFYLRNREGSIVNVFSSLQGLVKSLEELYSRFRNDGMIKKNYSALRQLFWGQFRFINRRLNANFSSVSASEKALIRNRALNTICEYFPELEGLTKYTFYAPSRDEKIIEAISRLVLDNGQILQDCNALQADFIVDFYDNTKSVFKEKQILIKKPTDFAADTETVIWNLADEIFQGIWR